MVQRVHYRRKCSYNTKRNRIRKVKTPGGRISVQYPGKKPSGPICTETSCRRPLGGIPKLRPTKYKSLSKRERKVSRAYGGMLCGKCLKEKILRAFLIEEVKIVKRVVSKQKGKEKDKEKDKPKDKEKEEKKD